MDDPKIIPFPGGAYPEDTSDAALERGPSPTQLERWPRHCWRFIPSRAGQPAHWNVVPHEVARFKREVAAAVADSSAPDTTPEPQPHYEAPAFEAGMDEEDWLDSCVVAFFKTYARLPVPAEKAFLVARGRWPLCDEEVAELEVASRPDRWALVAAVVVLLGGVLVTLFV